MKKTAKKLGVLESFRKFSGAVRADYGQIQRYSAKYHAKTIPFKRMPFDFIVKIGFQQAVGIRVMHLARDLRIPFGAQVASRLLRHLYSCEIHWDADIAPGLSIIHGNGLIISHAASVADGCILFQNVTLGEGIDPQTREVGGPRLERDVHVGPGATLLGPITVGAGTKIMAGATLARSVPPNSLVRPADAVIVERAGNKSGAKRKNADNDDGE